MRSRAVAFAVSITAMLVVNATAAAASTPITPGNSPTVLNGQTNGEVDSAQLVSVSPTCQVARDAAPSLAKLLADAKAKGIALGTTECYRPLDDQVAVSASWTAAGNSSCAAAVSTTTTGAKVGTSMHGWGKAVDFRFGNSSGFGTAGYNYLKANAAAYGWNHPGWAEPGGSSCPEAWHWEWVGDGGKAAADPVRADVAALLPTPDGKGYTSVTGLGSVITEGSAINYGSMADKAINWTMVGAGATADRKGYWMVGGDGGVFSYGDAQFYGSTGSLKLNQPVVGISATATGHGYWNVASDGGVFSYGDAKFFGSTGSIKLNKSVVGMASTPSANGYWLVASDGGVFAYGDAQFYGSTGSIKLAQPIVGIAPTPTGHGYWMVASDGGVFAYGDAQFYGSAANDADGPVVSITPTATGHGYWITAANGHVYSYGDAQYHGTA